MFIKRYVVGEILLFSQNSSFWVFHLTEIFYVKMMEMSLGLFL